MDLMGIEALYGKRRGTKRNPAHPVYPCLLRNLVIDCRAKPGRRTFRTSPMHHGFLYLVAVLNLFSWKVLSLVAHSNSLTSDFCIDAVEEGDRELRLPGDLQH